MVIEKTVFKKLVKTRAGKQFYKYITKMIAPDGTEKVVDVKFTKEAGEPEETPANIIITDGNIAATKNGEYVNYTLWVKAWEEGEQYEDKSLMGWE